MTFVVSDRCMISVSPSNRPNVHSSHLSPAGFGAERARQHAPSGQILMGRSLRYFPFPNPRICDELRLRQRAGLYSHTIVRAGIAQIEPGILCW